MDQRGRGGIGASIEGVEMASINSVPFGGGRVETSSNTKAKGGAPLSDILAPARTNGDEGGSAIGTDDRQGDEDDTCVEGEDLVPLRLRLRV